MSDTKLHYPFSKDSSQPVCDPNICPSQSPSLSPYPSTSTNCDSGSLANPNPSCKPCSEFAQEEENSYYYVGKFLGCDVIGFSAKLGFNTSESTLSVDLGTTGIPSNQNQQCAQFTDDYGIVHNCFDPNSCTSQDPVNGVCCFDTSCDDSLNQQECVQQSGVWIANKTCDDNPCYKSEYTGQLGYVYTFRVGKFCFRGILTDHQYVENDSGFRYRVNLGDGRQILSNVAVILTQYARVPESLKPNLINVLYESESSVGDNTCGSGGKCESFGKSGSGNQGMYLKKVLEAIDGKVCQLPKSGACLTINLSKVIDIAPKEYRVSSIDSNVMDLITLACEEAGYDFYVAIVGWEIKVFPINNKYQTAPQLDADAPLFQFFNKISDNSRVLDKEYGQELTFNKSKKIIVGDNIRYLTIVEPSSSPCIIDDPGSISIRDAINAKYPLPSCSILY